MGVQKSATESTPSRDDAMASTDSANAPPAPSSQKTKGSRFRGSTPPAKAASTCAIARARSSGVRNGRSRSVPRHADDGEHGVLELLPERGLGGRRRDG